MPKNVRSMEIGCPKRAATSRTLKYQSKDPRRGLHLVSRHSARLTPWPQTCDEQRQDWQCGDLLHLLVVGAPPTRPGCDVPRRRRPGDSDGD